MFVLTCNETVKNTAFLIRTIRTIGLPITHLSGSEADCGVLTYELTHSLLSYTKIVVLSRCGWWVNVIILSSIKKQILCHTYKRPTRGSGVIMCIQWLLDLRYCWCSDKSIRTVILKPFSAFLNKKLRFMLLEIIAVTVFSKANKVKKKVICN